VTRECVSAGHYTFLLVRPGSSTFLLPPLCDESSHGLHTSRVIGYRSPWPSAGAFLLVAPVVAVGVDVVAGDELVGGFGDDGDGGGGDARMRTLVPAWAVPMPR
jgi:hypothetical protein